MKAEKSPQEIIKMSPLAEIDIKAIVISQLKNREGISNSSIIANEFALDDVSRRIDLAILSDIFIGVEIKSEMDSLRRLPAQIAAYGRFFDRIILVAAENHLLKAAKIIPGTVSIWGLRKDGSIFIFRESETALRPVAEDLVKLLTLSELRGLIGKESSIGVSRKALLAMAAQLDINIVRDVVRIAFTKRFSVTSAAFWKMAEYDKKIHIECLDNLSRFKKQRSRHVALQREKKNFWQDWVSQSAFILADQNL